MKMIHPLSTVCIWRTSNHWQWSDNRLRIKLFKPQSFIKMHKVMNERKNYIILDDKYYTVVFFFISV